MSGLGDFNELLMSLGSQIYSPVHDIKVCDFSTLYASFPPDGQGTGLFSIVGGYFVQLNADVNHEV